MHNNHANRIGFIGRLEHKFQTKLNGYVGSLRVESDGVARRVSVANTGAESVESCRPDQEALQINFTTMALFGGAGLGPYGAHGDATI